MSTFTSMTDQELVQAYLDGNNHAFDELLSRTQDNIFSYIIRVVKDEELANELFQETFLKIISKIQNHQYTETGKLQWWMIRVAHNTVIDYYRDLKKNFVVDAPKENDLSAVKGEEVIDVNRETEPYQPAHAEAVGAADECPACTTARGGVYAILPGYVVQGDSRGVGMQHQYIVRTYALRPDQHAQILARIQS